MFAQMINNSKRIVVKNGKIEICNGSCCHSNCFKIINVSDCMAQIECQNLFYKKNNVQKNRF